MSPSMELLEHRFATAPRDYESLLTNFASIHGQPMPDHLVDEVLLLHARKGEFA